MPPALHPTPQFARSRWVDLCGTWGFAHDDADVGRDEGWPERADVFDRTIEVPFPPESPASGIAERGHHPVVWYRREFTSPHATGERLLLHLGAVDHRAQVWVNGRLVVEHEGGHTPFSCDVTPALAGAGPQVLVVRAEDPPRDPAQPRGKQDWLEQPHAVWYERTTGIWQPVWLEPVPPVRVGRVRWTPLLDRGVLRVRVELAGRRSTPYEVGVKLVLHGEVLADDTYVVGPADAAVERDIALDPVALVHDRRRWLWAPEHPNLVDATVTLRRDGGVVDEVASYAGLRSIAATGRSVELNGRPYVLRLVLAQGYWPQSHLAAPSPAALWREAELVKELGFNGVRMHQKVEDPRFLAACDRLGLLVWGELPSPLAFGPATVGRLAREWLEVLDRDASCPSLVAWVPLNESWGVPQLAGDEAQRHAVRALYSLTKAVDPTRLVIGNDGWEHLVSDVLSVHDYSADAAVLRERYGDAAAVERTLRHVAPYYRRLVLPGYERAAEPLVVTEFGGVTYDAGVPSSAAARSWNGYGAVETADELLRRYGQLVGALLDSPEVAGFCYTQLTDTAQERNGLLDEDRRPKADLRALAAVTRRPAAAVPADGIAEVQLRQRPEPRSADTRT